MCTTVALRKQGLFYGRNMDIECGFGQRVVITPRNYILKFKKCAPKTVHYSIIGMAALKNNYPLYADAVNECGLAAAGLNFPENAYYSKSEKSDKLNISPFELIPFVLSQCADIDGARELLSQINPIDIDFDESLALTSLHWHFADKNGSIVFECTQSGCYVYDNPLDVLTNNPPFEYHLQNYGLYCNLSSSNPEDTQKCNLGYCSAIGKGLGAIGMPGDFSSQSRFVKAAFLLENSKTKNSDVAQVFNILSSVQVVNGSINLGEDKDYYTLYSSCIDAHNLIYYYKCYDDLSVRCVDMHKENLEGENLIEFEL